MGDNVALEVDFPDLGYCARQFGMCLEIFMFSGYRGTTKIRVILRDKCCLLAVQVFIKASRADEIVKGGSRDPHNFSNRCLRHLLIQKRLDLQFFTIEL